MIKQCVIAAGLLALVLASSGCGKGNEEASDSLLKMASLASANKSTTAQESYPRHEEHPNSSHTLELALDLSRDITPVTGLQGKFEGYESADAIARRTDAGKNFLWSNYTRALSHSKQGPFGLTSRLGDFVVLHATTPENQVMGLVINLSNQKTALFVREPGPVSPAGDSLASAVVIYLEAEHRVKEALSASGYSSDILRDQTTRLLEASYSRLSNGDRPVNPLDDSRANLGMKATDGAFAEAAAVQRSAIAQDQTEREAKERDAARLRAMDVRLLNIFFAVYEDAKRGGVKVIDPLPAMEDSNRSRRNAGIWELKVQRYGADPHFIETWDLQRPSGAFNVEGIGLMFANGLVRDEDFDEKGVFSPACKFEIRAGRGSVTYGCLSFYEGKHDDEVFLAIRNLIIEEIKTAGKANVAQTASQSGVARYEKTP